MKIPTAIIKQISGNYKEADWCIFSLNQDNSIRSKNLAAQDILKFNQTDTDIKKVLPLLATESFAEPFYQPLCSHQDKVYDVHFLLEAKYKYLVLIPVDQQHQNAQPTQQINQQQSKQNQKLKTLFSTLEAAQEELKAANSAKSFYISALSHEIGNPLNVIKGYNQLLSEGSIEVEKAAQIIQRNVNKLERIISQSIDYDREQTKKFSTLIKPAELIEDQFHDFRIKANNKNLKLVNQVDPDIIVASNKTKWNQIFTNLISNAIKYTDSGEITVSSNTTEHMLHIDVTDSGCGMSPEYQQQLFTAWSREQNNQSQGHGIGLVISRMLAEQINAQLNLHSSGPHGSCFRFSTTYQQPQKSQKILLVDDDPDCLNLFKHFLTEAGHHIKTADSIKALKKQLSAFQFDVLVTDLNLTDGQSHLAYPKIKHLVDKIIIMSASLTDEMRQDLESLGIDQILSKPLTKEQLVNSITQNQGQFTHH